MIETEKSPALLELATTALSSSSSTGGGGGAPTPPPPRGHAHARGQDDVARLLQAQPPGGAVRPGNGAALPASAPAAQKQPQPAGPHQPPPLGGGGGGATGSRPPSTTAAAGASPQMQVQPPGPPPPPPPLLGRTSSLNSRQASAPTRDYSEWRRFLTVEERQGMRDKIRAAYRNACHTYDDLLTTVVAIEEELLHISAPSRLDYFKSGCQFDKRVHEKRKQFQSHSATRAAQAALADVASRGSSSSPQNGVDDDAAATGSNKRAKLDDAAAAATTSQSSNGPSVATSSSGGKTAAAVAGELGRK